MARSLVDLDSLDLSQDVVGEEELRRMLPHQHEFQLIDGICHVDVNDGLIVGYKDWGEDPWWARGHIPGRPLMPGVLMIEGGAQVGTVLMKMTEGWEAERFIGLGGVDDVRFRGQVLPNSRIYFASRRGQRSGNRMAKYFAQGYCNGKQVMDMKLLGVLL
ncbi:MAG: 3-hydroxyacyl-ACP dehydratase FabZ family protein [Planctomycetota bacterium]